MRGGCLREVKNLLAASPITALEMISYPLKVGPCFVHFRAVAGQEGALECFKLLHGDLLQSFVAATGIDSAEKSKCSNKKWKNSEERVVAREISPICSIDRFDHDRNRNALLAPTDLKRVGFVACPGGQRHKRGYPFSIGVFKIQADGLRLGQDR